MGAGGRVVETEDQLDEALDQAMNAEGPFVVDVRVDATESSPLLERFDHLLALVQSGDEVVCFKKAFFG